MRVAAQTAVPAVVDREDREDRVDPAASVVEGSAEVVGAEEAARSTAK
jgi:hypothetical protein